MVDNERWICWYCGESNTIVDKQCELCGATKDENVKHNKPKKKKKK